MDEDRNLPADGAERKRGKPCADDREARLAAALRANLRRRKAAAPSPDPKRDR